MQCINNLTVPRRHMFIKTENIKIMSILKSRDVALVADKVKD